jgi:hypothetical protein
MLWSNNSNAADIQEPLVLCSMLSAAADLSRYAALDYLSGIAGCQNYDFI